VLYSTPIPTTTTNNNNNAISHQPSAIAIAITSSTDVPPASTSCQQPGSWQLQLPAADQQSAATGTPATCQIRVLALASWHWALK
jgi:hypothetical protein